MKIATNLTRHLSLSTSQKKFSNLLFHQGVTSMKEELRLGWQMYASLPESNWFKKAENIVTDHKNFGDAGFYDLFLHKQDVCYSIEELNNLVGQAGLEIVDFSEATSRIRLSPERLVNEEDRELLERIMGMDRPGLTLY